ncbi:hypothetical protein GUITHDRAFT_120541 [Guillardia theta CCMP2712]|uniref:Uncharacterized protein n=1 Tax=Guillardia theta (strain CCMP2712) TaxID=905079 RepID=L1IB40_GUITC|nr:hypothetical protein GUITHDRAFT_120541 [Guillardia theta CCMP2712]EKX33277.1 hypothetical protein GUITHDRAFT_120541 [Guillardia theta CCMP2712]|eukprot:XP_005820257.1 hypothetical protein GUITHDRAFT_120541 [Guillardia theta CCMP2712]
MSSNLLRLVGNASYVQGLKEKMRIGKLPLALKALSIGIPADQLLIDVAQAGGLHGKSDGCIIVGPQRQVSGSSRGEPLPLCREPLEVKSSSCRSGDRTFGIKSIRRSFRHLFIVGRKDNPDDWTSLDALDDKCSLGYISGEDYDIALERHLVRQGRWPAASDEPQDVTVTMNSRKRTGWLSQHIRWVGFKDLTLQWWQATVGSSVLAVR